MRGRVRGRDEGMKVRAGHRLCVGEGIGVGGSVMRGKGGREGSLK